MRAAVVAAWPAMCRRFEGVTTWMYLDTKGLVTTGVGFLINTVAEAQALPWQTKDGKPATATQIKAEWTRVRNQQAWKKFNGLNAVWRNSAVLSLPMETVDAKLLETTDRFWKRLSQALPQIETFPADAQLALMDESWQNGPAFLDAGTSWTNTRACALAQDWARVAKAVPGNDGSERKTTRIRLFNNAAKVVQLGLDRDVLWNTRTPVATAPTPTPTPAPQETVMHSDKYRCDYVSWRGGNFPLGTRAKLLAIPSTVRVTQGGLSFAPASAMTHAGLGAFDLNTDGMTKDQVWQQARELLSVGIIPFPRGFNADSFQGRTISNTNDGNEHLHCIDTDEYDHLHPEAQAQVNEWKRGGDGLVGSARYYGPSGSLGKWADSPWNPKNIAIKELELPTSKEVAAELATNDKFLDAIASRVTAAIFAADVIPNVFTGNAANTTVTLPTALKSIGTKNSAIASAVAAAFPGSTPPPAAA